MECFLEEVFERFQDTVGCFSTRLPCEMGRSQ